MDPGQEVPTIGVVVEINDGGKHDVLPEFRAVCPPDLSVGDSFTVFGATAKSGSRYDGRHGKVGRISHQYSGNNPNPLFLVISVDLKAD